MNILRASTHFDLHTITQYMLTSFSQSVPESYQYFWWLNPVKTSSILHVFAAISCLFLVDNCWLSKISAYLSPFSLVLQITINRWYKPFPVMGGLWHCFNHIYLHFHRVFSCWSLVVSVIFSHGSPKKIIGAPSEGLPRFDHAPGGTPGYGSPWVAFFLRQAIKKHYSII